MDQLSRSNHSRNSSQILTPTRQKNQSNHSGTAANNQVTFDSDNIHIVIEIDDTQQIGSEQQQMNENYFQNIAQKILEKVPNAQIDRKQVQQEGCFEIKEAQNDQIIWSKLYFQQYPDPIQILDRILCFYYDALTNGDIYIYHNKADISSEKLGYKINIWQNGAIKIQKIQNQNFRIKKQPSNSSHRTGNNTNRNINNSNQINQQQIHQMSQMSNVPAEKLNEDLIYLYQNYDCCNCQTASRVFNNALLQIENYEQIIKDKDERIYKLEEKEMQNMANSDQGGGQSKMVSQLLDMKNFFAKREKMFQDENNNQAKKILSLQQEIERYDDEVEDYKKQIMEVKRHINPELEDEYESIQQKNQDLSILTQSQQKQMEQLQFLINQLEVKHLELQRQLKNRERDLLISKSRIESMEKLLKIKSQEAKEGSERLKWERKEKDQKIVQLQMLTEDQQQKIDILQETLILKISEKDTEIEEYKETKQNFNKILQSRVKEYEDQIKKILKMHSNDKEKMSEYFYFYKKKHQLVFRPKNIITLGFIWNVQGDFEAKVSLLNDLREFQTSCNLKMKFSENQEFIHQGQRNNGIYNQEILIDLQKIPLFCGVLAVTVTSQQGINNIKKGLCHVIEGGEVCEQFVMKNIYGQVKSYLIFYLRRQEDGNWRIMPAQKGLDTPLDTKLIIDNIQLSGYDFGPIQESLNWNERTGKIYQITNNQVIAVPLKAYDNFTLGLGWDTPLDLDGSAIMFDKNGKLVDNVYFQNLTSKDGGVVHQGDEQEGKDEGDDEQIHFSLNKIDQQVESIWIFICIYEKDKQFDDVEGAYGRFLVGDTEFCKYNMSDAKDPEANGSLMCNLFRVKKKWMIKGRGYFTKETYTSEEVIPIIGEVCDNNYEHVKIFTNEPDDEEDNEEQIDYTQHQNKEVIFDSTAQIKILFKWNANTKLSALNAHAVLLSDEGEKLETVNMRQMTTQNNCLTHSGKVKEKDYDQEIQIILSLLEEKVYTIAIMVTGLRALNEMTKEGRITVMYQDQIVHVQNFTQIATGKSYLSMFISRSVGDNFKLYPSQAPFAEANIRKILKDSMHLAGKRAKVNMDALNWNVDTNKSFKLENDMLIPVPSVVQEEMIIGLGWDTPLDLDSSLIMLDSKGHVIENIWWNNLETKGIVHQGDNRTGGEEGDDETIKVQLLKVSENVREIWVFVCLFEKESKFIDVNGEYFRILVHGKEFARMDLGEIEDETVNGCILCNFFLNEKNEWFLKGRGYYTQNTFTSQDAEPVIKMVSKDDYSQVQIFNNAIGGDGGQPKKLTKFPFNSKLKLKLYLDVNKQLIQQLKTKLQMFVRYIDSFGNQVNQDYLLEIKKIGYPMFLNQRNYFSEDDKHNTQLEHQQYEITMDFDKIPPEIYCLSFMINCKDIYKIITGGSYEIMMDDAVVFQYQMHLPVDKSEYQHILLFFLHLDIQENWQLLRINQSDSSNIGNEDKLISKYIDKVGIDAKCIKQSQSWNPNSQIMFNLRQGDSLIIPQSGYGGMQLGLGWITDLNLDCCLIMIDDNHQMYDYIYYDNLKSKDKSIMHLGDAKQGADGDSEVLSIILKSVHISVKTILVYIHIYSEGKHLCDVQKSYARLVIGGEEFCRFEVAQASDGISDGCIMAYIYRITPSQWGIKAVGLYTQQAHSRDDMVEIIKQIKNHDYSKTRQFSQRHGEVLPRVQQSSQNKKQVQKVITKFKNDQKLSLGLKWSLFLKINLNSFVFAIDKEGNIIQKIDCEENLQQPGMKNTGRLKTGEYKQLIDIDFSELPEQTHALAIAIWSPQILADYFRNGCITFILDQSKVYVVEMTNATQEGLLLQYIVKDIYNEGFWTLGGSVKGMEKENNDEVLVKKYLDLTQFERIEHIQRKFSPQSTIFLGLLYNYGENLGIKTECLVVNDIGLSEGGIENFNNQGIETSQSLHTLQTENDFDEIHKIKFNKIPQHLNIVALIVTSEIPVGGNLQSGSCQVQYEGKIQHNISFKDIQETGVLILFIKRSQQGQWELINYVKGFQAKSSQELLDEYFHLTGIEGVRASEIRKAKQWNFNNPISLQIVEDQVLPLPDVLQTQLETSKDSKFTIGLGWDSKVDVDAAVIMMDSVGNIYDNIFHQNLKSRDLSIIHRGDNKGGETDGDDESIDVNLGKIDESVQSIWVFISIFTENKFFDNVRGAYVRLVINDKFEFCKYNVVQANDGESNGCLVAEISRKSGFWTIKGKGYYTQNTPSSESIIPILGKVFKGDLTQVRLFAQQDSSSKLQKPITKKELYSQPLQIGFSVPASEQVTGSIFMINEMGEIIDYVELFRKQSKCKSIKHTGLIQEGEYTQMIDIVLKQVDPACRVLGITIDTKNHSLTKVLETGAKVDLLYDNQVYKSFKLKEEVDKALCVVYLKKNLKDPHWNVVAYNKKYFVSSTAKNVVHDSLVIAGLNYESVQKALNYNPLEQNKSLQIKNDQILPIPQCAHKNFILGCGWDSETDIDSSVLIMDKDGGLLDKVYFNNLKSKDWAVIHKGELTKTEEQIDDEQIEIKLEKLNPNVSSIWVFLSVFQSGKNFDQVKQSHVRLLIENQEFCKYNLCQQKDGISNGQLICEIYKFQGVGKPKWVIRGRGYLTQKTSSALEVIPILKNVLKGDLSEISLPTDS